MAAGHCFVKDEPAVPVPEHPGRSDDPKKNDPASTEKAGSELWSGLTSAEIGHSTGVCGVGGSTDRVPYPDTRS